MIKIRKIRKNEYDILMNVMNTSFNFKGDDVFECILPRIYWKDNKDMIHFGLFDDGKLVSSIGVYKETFVNDEGVSITSGCVGAVSTLPEYRNKGYFSLLMKHVMRYIKRSKKYDIAMLSGKYERYSRFGFEYAGSSFRFNVKKSDAHSILTMHEVKSDSIQYLREILGMYNSIQQHAIRNIDNIYKYLVTWKSKPFVFEDSERVVGYACIKGNEIFELYYKENYLLKIIEKLSTLGDYLILLPGFTNPNLLENKYEYFYRDNHMFVICNIDKIAQYLKFKPGFEEILPNIPKKERAANCLGIADTKSSFGMNTLSISLLDFS